MLGTPGMDLDELEGGHAGGKRASPVSHACAAADDAVAPDGFVAATPEMEGQGDVYMESCVGEVSALSLSRAHAVSDVAVRVGCVEVAAALEGSGALAA